MISMSFRDKLVCLITELPFRQRPNSRLQHGHSENRPGSASPEAGGIGN
jgi:hypothetical protein